MRIFIGIPFSGENKKDLGKIQKTIIEKSRGGRFSDPKNFHLTVKFIGEVEDEKLPEIIEVLKKTAKEESAFRLTLQGFGTFPKGKTCIPWLGVDKGLEDLVQLQEKIETALEEVGYKKESRPFHPHMTFGRKVQLSSLDEAYLTEGLKQERIIVEVSSIAVMESTRIHGELVYPIVKEFPLKKAREL